MIYAGHASPAFNEWMREMLLQLAQDVRHTLGANLVALILGGGYGRGEGGVVWREGREQPYNDLDLVLIVQNKQIASEALEQVSREYADLLAIHVDFSRPLTLLEVRRWPCWLMWQDLLHGHIVLEGDVAILLDNAAAEVCAPLPVIEATRLLLNRGAGLLWAMRIANGIEPAPDADFVRRNLYKCALALGDALLIAYGRYMTPYTGRDTRFAQLESRIPGVAAMQLSALYRDALRFKFSPDDVPDAIPNRESLAQIAALWRSVFLAVENKRDNKTWPTIEAYCASNRIREPEQNLPVCWLRNLARNLQIGALSPRYPRETLYRQLPFLLGPDAPEQSDWAMRGERFLSVWKRFC